MSLDSVIDLRKACGRELSEAEAARLREVGNSLGLREDDALWPLLAALEYQRVYYEALPEKIAGASKEIMDGMTAAAQRETAAAQARLTDSVVKEAEYLASTIQYAKLVPMGLLALICLLAYGSLMLWAGYRIATGRDLSLESILYMPSGWLVCGLSLVAGMFCAWGTMKEGLRGEEGYWIKAIGCFGFLSISIILFIGLI